MISEGVQSQFLASLHQGEVHSISAVLGCAAPVLAKSGSMQGRVGLGEDAWSVLITGREQLGRPMSEVTFNSNTWQS